MKVSVKEGSDIFWNWFFVFFFDRRSIFVLLSVTVSLLAYDCFSYFSFFVFLNYDRLYRVKMAESGFGPRPKGSKQGSGPRAFVSGRLAVLKPNFTIFSLRCRIVLFPKKNVAQVGPTTLYSCLTLLFWCSRWIGLLSCRVGPTHDHL